MKGRFPEPPRFDPPMVTGLPDRNHDVPATMFSSEQLGDEKINMIDDTFSRKITSLRTYPVCFLRCRQFNQTDLRAPTHDPLPDYRLEAG